MKDNEIMEALETLAATFPWDDVDIWIHRYPQGDMTFSAILNDNNKLGFRFASSRGTTPMEAVKRIAESEVGKRDPEISRKRRIQELTAEVARLQEMVIGLPPYRPNRELAQVNPIQAPQTIEV